MTPIALVFFDLGGVVCRFHPERRLSAMAEHSGIDADEIQRRIWGSGFSDACDAGAHTAAEMCERLRRELEVDLSQEALHRLFACAFEPTPAALEIAAQVRFYAPVGLLTNNPPLLRAALFECLPDVAHRFDPLVFSCEHSKTKPDPELFRAVEHRVRLPGERLLLIDEVEANVRAARAQGWHGIHFRSPAELRRDLLAFELLDP